MYTKYSIEQIKNELKASLNEERYIHSIGTMEKAMELARQFNCDVEKSQVAGLLHDCAKCFSKEKLLEHENTFEDCEKLSIKTWHAPVGAYVAKHSFGVVDEEILSAIRWHTVGKLNMTDFEKIIFLADKIEERTREEEFRIKIETVLNNTNSLDEAMLKSFEITIESLLIRKLPICYQTIDVYNNLLEKTQK